MHALWAAYVLHSANVKRPSTLGQHHFFRTLSSIGPNTTNAMTRMRVLEVKSLVVESKRHLHGNLPVSDLAVFNVTANLSDLEPS